nr:hypothetical protein [Gilliamella apicola]
MLLYIEIAFSIIFDCGVPVSLLSSDMSSIVSIGSLYPRDFTRRFSSLRFWISDLDNATLAPY